MCPAAMGARLVPHLDAPLCIFLQPPGAKAPHNVNLEIHPLAQQLPRVSNHVFLTTGSRKRRDEHWVQVSLDPSNSGFGCQRELHRLLKRWPSSLKEEEVKLPAVELIHSRDT